RATMPPTTRSCSAAKLNQGRRQKAEGRRGRKESLTFCLLPSAFCLYISFDRFFSRPTDSQSPIHRRGSADGERDPGTLFSNWVCVRCAASRTQEPAQSCAR